MESFRKAFNLFLILRWLNIALIVLGFLTIVLFMFLLLYFETPYLPNIFLVLVLMLFGGWYGMACLVWRLQNYTLGSFGVIEDISHHKGGVVVEYDGKKYEIYRDEKKGVVGYACGFFENEFIEPAFSVGISNISFFIAFNRFLKKN